MKNLKKQFEIETVFIIRTLVLILLSLVGLDSLRAQQEGVPLPSVNGESSQTVSLYTGRLSVNLPLMSMSGRGESGAGLSILNRGAADWKVAETSRIYHPTTAQLISINYAAESMNLGPNLGYSPLSLSFQVARGGLNMVWDPSGPMTSYLVLQTSDGNKVNFIDSLREGEPTEINTNQYNGPIVQCNVVYGIQWTPTSPPPPPAANPPSYCSRGKVFHSTDGSAMTFVSDYDVYDAFAAEPNDPWGTINYFAHMDGSNGRNLNLAGYLYMSNGTKYKIKGGKAVAIIDRNGNTTSLEYVAPPYAPPELVHCDSNSVDLSPCRLSKITDSINREVNIGYGAYSETEEYSDTISYKGFGGADRQIKIYYDRMSHAMYPGLSIQNSIIMGVDAQTGATSQSYGGSPYNPQIISRIELPNGQEYQYQYNGFGEIARFKIPSGAYTDYTYGALPDPRVCESLVQTKRTDPNGLTWTKSPFSPYEIPDGLVRRVTEAKVYDKNGSLQNKTTYSDIGSERPVMVAAKDPNDTTLHASKHYFIEAPCTDFWNFRFRYFDDWRENREYKTEVYASENSPSPLRINETVWEQRTSFTWGANHPFANVANASNDPRVVESKTTLETGQVTKKTYAYDQYNNLTDTYEYDYGNGQAGAFLRRNHTDYISDTNYTSYTGSHLRGLPLQSWVSSDNAGSNKISLSQIEYDNYNSDAIVSRSNASGHDSLNYGTSKIRRGNVTKATAFSSATNQTGAISNYSSYDILGNIIKTTDGNGNISSIGYADNFGTPDAEALTNSSQPQLNSQNAYAFQTQITNPLSWNSFVQYDYFTGQPVNSQDVNGVISKTTYQDIFDRPTQSVTAVGTSHESQTTTVYDYVNHTVQKTSDLNSLNDNLIKTVSYFDSLGRPIETRSYEGDGNYRAVQKQYDALGRAHKQSNPFRPTELDTNHPILWTQSYFDVLGRIVKVKTPDNAEATTTYYGNTSISTDPSGKLSRHVINALGRLTRVDEPNLANELGTTSNPHQSTHYTYNTMGKMIRVQQGVQNRYFMYDSLGRIQKVRQPEQEINSDLNSSGNPDNNSWTAGFTYDNNGNVLTTTDAKGITITNTYDSLNRALTRAYSDPTPTVTNYYDGAGLPSVPNHSKGRLTKVSSTVSDSKYTLFDPSGNLLESQQITDGQTYISSFQYNLSGALIEETYPSGRVVKNILDNSGDLSVVESKKTSASGYWHYADNFKYNSAGAVTRMQIGNGLWETAQFNIRLQVTQIGTGNTDTDTSRWEINYEYGELDTNGNTDSTKNNGNIAKQTLSFAGLADPITQTYKYDPLNRLTEAKETANETQNWIQNWTYDRYGNRTSFSQNISGNNAASNPTVDAYTNRFVSGQGFTYDKDGNVITDIDSVTGNARQFTYNGDNKQIQVNDPSLKQIKGTYYYDGEGKRIKKVTETETTIFIYSGGKVVAEYSTTVAPFEDAKVSYTTADQLGTPRLITDQNGNVTSRRDFMPFGEELSIGTGARSETLHYGSNEDTVRQKFTGYQKDDETSLDFAEARYYDNRYGRFTAVDPLLASGQSANPQTFNRYIYVANNSPNSTDPTGMWADSQWYTYEPGFFTPMYDDGVSVRFPRDFGSVVGYIRVTTTTITITQKEHKGNDKSTPVTQQATITVTRVIIETLDSFKHVTHTSSPSYDSSGVNSGVGGFKGDDLDRMALAAKRIVEVAFENSRDVVLFLAIAQNETHLGNGAWQDPGNVGNPAMEQTVNPLQLDKRSGVEPSSTNWKYNISQAMAFFDSVMQRNFPNVKSKWNASLETKLQTYNGGGRGPTFPSSRAYSADIINMKNNIRVNTRTEFTGVFGIPNR